MPPTKKKVADGNKGKKVDSESDDETMVSRKNIVDAKNKVGQTKSTRLNKAKEPDMPKLSESSTDSMNESDDNEGAKAKPNFRENQKSASNSSMESDGGDESEVELKGRKGTKVPTASKVRQPATTNKIVSKPKETQSDKKNDSEQSASGSSAESENEDESETKAKDDGLKNVPAASKGRQPAKKVVAKPKGAQSNKKNDSEQSASGSSAESENEDESDAKSLPAASKGRQPPKKVAPKPKGAQPNKKNDSEQSASGSSAESSNEDGNEAETKGRKGRSVPNATKGRLPKPAATKKIVPKPKEVQPNKKNDSEHSASGSSGESGKEDGSETKAKKRGVKIVTSASKGSKTAPTKKVSPKPKGAQLKEKKAKSKLVRKNNLAKKTIQAAKEDQAQELSDNMTLAETITVASKALVELNGHASLVSLKKYLTFEKGEGYVNRNDSRIKTHLKTLFDRDLIYPIKRSKAKPSVTASFKIRLSKKNQSSVQGSEIPKKKALKKTASKKSSEKGEASEFSDNEDVPPKMRS